MATVFITGGNRGIGLGLVKQFLKDLRITHLIASTRNIEASKELTAIPDNRLHVVELDISSDESIKNVVPKVEKILGSAPLDILINNSGIHNRYRLDGPIDRRKALQHFDVNAVGVMITIQAFLPLIRANPRGVKIVNISSTAGSIERSLGQNGDLAITPYAMSKSALNQLTRTVALDLKDTPSIVASFCPGWVKTNLGTEAADLTVEESVPILVDSINRLEKKHSGGFYERNLAPYPF